MKYILRIMVFTLLLIVSSNLFGQDVVAHKVTVILNSSQTDDPVNIVKTKIGKQNILPGIPFTVQGDEWIDNISITLRNMSNKVLIYTSVNIDFPETGAGTSEQPRLGEQLQAGILPAPVRHFADGKPIDISEDSSINIGPNQETTLTQPYSLDQHRKLLATRNMTVNSIHQIRIIPLVFYFSDGTRWAFGNFQAPDEANPSKYHDITASQFYGRTSE